jgi:hypothetical protein
MRVLSTIWLVAAGALVAGGCSGGGRRGGSPNPLLASRQANGMAPTGGPTSPEIVGSQVCVHGIDLSKAIEFCNSGTC